VTHRPRPAASLNRGGVQLYCPAVEIERCLLGESAPKLGPYTILPSPILYGVWDPKGGRWGGVYCAMVVQ